MNDPNRPSYDGLLQPSLAGPPIPWDWDAFAETQAAYAHLGFAPEVEA